MTDFITDLNTSLAKHKEELALRNVPVRIWNDKTTSMIVWMTAQEAKRHKALTRRVGQQSTIRNVLHNGGKLC
jgi:hypothetical protein